MAASDASAAAGLAQVRASAAANLARALNSDAPAPVPTPPAPETPPAPAVAAPAAPATPPPQPAAPSPASPGGAPAAEGSPPSGQPTAPTTIDLSVLTPEARRYLEMKGGDANRALAEALRDNNRLAELSRTAPTAPAAPAGQPPGTVAAPASPPAPEVPPLDAPVELDAKAVEDHVARLVDEDPDLAKLAKQYDTAHDRILAIAGEDGQSGKVAEISREIDRLEYRLTLPDTDEFAKDPIRQEIRDKKFSLQELKAERRDLQADQKDFKARYQERAGAYRQRVTSALTQQAQAERQRAARDQSITRHTEALKAEWEPAISRAATKHHIPDELLGSFRSRARTQALANLEQGITVDEIDPFMDGVATGLVTDLDTYHRAQAGIHARDALARAAQSAPTAPPVAPTPEPAPTVTRAPSQASHLKQTYQLARQRLHAGMTGQR